MAKVKTSKLEKLQKEEEAVLARLEAIKRDRAEAELHALADLAREYMKYLGVTSIEEAVLILDSLPAFETPENIGNSTVETNEPAQGGQSHGSN